MKNTIWLFIIVPFFLFGETPWHTVSFGILNNAGSATFHNEKIFWGFEVDKLSLEGSWIDDDVSKSVSMSAWLLSPRIGKKIDLKSSTYE